MKADSIEDILTALRNGEPGAKDLLYKLAMPYVSKLAQKERLNGISKDNLNTGYYMEAASDITQDALMKVFNDKSLETLEREQEFLDRLRFAVRTIILTNVRKFSAVKRDKSSLGVNDGGVVDNCQTDEQINFFQALMQLDSSYPDVSRCFEMKYFLEWSEVEIASRMEISDWDVRKKIRFAKAYLAENGTALNV